MQVITNIQIQAICGDNLVSLRSTRKRWHLQPCPGHKRSSSLIRLQGTLNEFNIHLIAHKVGGSENMRSVRSCRQNQADGLLRQYWGYWPSSFGHYP